MSDEEIGAKLDALLEVNRDIRRWMRVMAWDRAKAVVREALRDRPEEYRFYEALDGETPVGDAIEDSGMPRRTAYNRLKEWQRVGIVSKVERGKYERIASLDSLGIGPPDETEE